MPVHILRLSENIISMLFVIELKTLIVFIVPLFVLKWLFLMFTFRIRRQPFLQWLAYGCLFFAMGWLLFLLRFEYGINVLTLPLANVFILLLPLSLAFSVLSFLRVPYSKRALLTTFMVLVLTFLVLLRIMHETWAPGVYTSILNGVLYIIPGYLFLKLARPRPFIVWVIIWLNFLAASILILRSFVLVLGWIYPGFITSLVITELLTAALFLNVICVDAQILCFPILDFIAAQNALTIANQKLEDLTNTDELTGLLNRRALNARLDLAFSGYSMDGRTLSVILFDIDHFKRVNDSFGHLMGDKVIRKIADLAKKQVRSNDLVMRYGGEEFLVFLPETDCSEALDIAERLRVGIAQFHFDLPELSTSFQVTASFGVADLRAEMLSMSDLLQHADIALYKAKVQGRNQVCV